MVKYVFGISLLAVMGAAIAIIDASSTGITPTMPAGHATTASSRIYAAGVVEGASEEVHVRSERMGRVAEVLAAEGDWVEKGDILVRLDSAVQQQEVLLAEAQLELARAQLERIRNGARPAEREEARATSRAAEARLEQAERAWRRIEHLKIQQAVAEQDADDHLAAVKALRAEVEAARSRAEQIDSPAREDEPRAAEARVAAAQAELNLAQLSLAKTCLCAPQSGRILDVQARVGELIKPDAAPTVVLADTTTMCVRAYVEELDAPRVRVGLPARIAADGLPGEVITGTVISTSPRMQAKSLESNRPGELYDTKVREVLIRVDQAAELIAGLRVDVSLYANMR